MKNTSVCTIFCFLLLTSAALADAPADKTGVPHRISALGEITGPELVADRHSYALAANGDDLLTAGDYVGAEKLFREAQAATDWNPQADRGLAEALAGEGRLGEALQTYREITLENPHRMTSITQETRTQMGFAIVLSQTGNWQEAVGVYENALPKTTHFGVAPKIDIHFDPNVPMPAQLQALAHVSIGTEYTGFLSRVQAFSEFSKAIRSEPNSPFANYYYGYGWGSLDPKDKERLINAQHAKAALQKAEKTGNADVKAAAARALKALG